MRHSAAGLHPGAFHPESECAEDAGLRSSQGVTPPLPASAVDWGQTRSITVLEAAYRLNRSTNTIYRWLRQGRLRGYQPGGRGGAIRVSEKSVKDLLIRGSYFR